ncbi:MAG TPA: hypothetical protein EYP77_11095, partial [Anaerolineae bacterium]|nr:hypothetical protein [Anaerolineae bacterium]
RPRAGRPARCLASASIFCCYCATTLLIIVLLTACQPLTVTREPVTLHVVASDACGPLMEELARAYQTERPWVTVRVEVFDTAAALDRLRAGGADLAAISWAGEDARSLWTAPFATDTIAVIVHPAVPAEEIGLAELREVFRGRTGEWSDGTPVQVVSREAGSGVRAIFETVVMGGYDVTLTALVVPDTAGVLEAVAITPGSIGYVPQGRLGDGVRVLPIEGRQPRPTAPEGYPLAHPLLLAVPAEPVGEVRAFIQWILGPQGQQRVARRLGQPP